MKILPRFLSFTFLLLLFVSCSEKAATTAEQPSASETLMGNGRQPQLAMDTDGVTRVVYGLGDSIYCATSKDYGKTFSEPAVIGNVPGLLLGMAMGPQIASSDSYSIVTAIDKKGNIHAYSLNHETGNWAKKAAVNDVPNVAAEGLMSIASDSNDTFYAVWLDVRDNKQNKIALASATGAAEAWSPNRIVYESPDSTVCECCKPSIHVKDQQVTLMFRNWVDGCRDFYYTSSTDKGHNFTTAEKLGNGTWKLEGCPMDGGGIIVDEKNNIHSTWQRNGKIYYAQPGSPEVEIGKGRNARIMGATVPAILWQDGSELKFKTMASGKETIVGKGSYIEALQLPDNSTLCVWENDKKIYFRKL